MNNYFFQNINLTELHDRTGIIIAYSGGIDSLTLCVLIDEYIRQHGLDQIQVEAVIINHKFIPEDDEYTNRSCELFNSYIKRIKCRVLVPEEGDSQITNNIEANMRDMRYQLLYDYCKKVNAQYLFLAHHQDDQIATFFMRLMRGSGLDGLGCMERVMSYKDICLVRPLLNMRKKELRGFLEKKEYSWVEDRLNHDQLYLRNKIDHFLSELPFQALMPDQDLFYNRISLAIEHLNRARHYIDIELENHFKCLVSYDEKYRGYKILCSDFVKLDREIGLRLLTKILMILSNKSYKPRFKTLEAVYERILQEEHIKCLTIYGCKVFTRKNIYTAKKNMLFCTVE